MYVLKFTIFMKLPDPYDDPNPNIINIKQHNIRICSNGAVIILEHTLNCNCNSDICRKNIINYMIKEGYLDNVDEIIVIDSYVKITE